MREFTAFLIGSVQLVGVLLSAALGTATVLIGAILGLLMTLPAVAILVPIITLVKAVV